MSRPPTKRLAHAPASPRPARHRPDGYTGDREAGAAPQPPGGAAPTPLDSLAPSAAARERSDSNPPTRMAAKAALTIFEGQAVFRLFHVGGIDLPQGPLFRLRRGSRTISIPPEEML